MTSSAPSPLLRLDRNVGGGVFGTDPARYDAGRIGYPDAMFAAIRDYAAKPVKSIVEAGRGTGISTRGLLTLNPERLVAVEPDPVLAARLAEALDDPRVEVLAPVLADYTLAPSEGATGHYSLDVEHHRSAMAGAGFAGLMHHIFRRERELTRAQLQALYASYSFVRALERGNRAVLLAEIDRIAETRFGDRAPNIVVTALYPGASAG